MRSVKRLRIAALWDRKFAAIWGLGLLLALYGWLNPLRLGHGGVLLAFLILLVASRASRSLAVALWPAAIFGFAYDLMRLLLNRAYDMTPSAVVYQLEAALFGWMSPSSGALGPVDYFARHHTLFLDLPAALWYSTHIPSVILFGLYVWWRSERGREPSARRVDRYFWGFLLFNAIGMTVWAIFPVAPPWYVAAHGLAAPESLNLGHPLWGDPAGLARVDAWLGTPYFADLYRQSTYVFGAMPSLHAAAPIWVALWARKTWLRVLLWGYALMMCFFAVYLTHHYVIDVLAGALLAGAIYGVLAHTRAGAWAIALNQWLRQWLDALLGQPISARVRPDLAPATLPVEEGPGE